MHRNRITGFTIVELLIVVVVIAILAAISVVAYTSIQNRANDSVVQNDISNLAKKIALYRVEFDRYPAGYNTTIQGMTRFSLAQGSYSTAVHNFFYCTGDVSGNAEFAIGATSKSGNRFYFSSLQGGVVSYMGNLGWQQPGVSGHAPRNGNLDVYVWI
jgi:prepilin-type N-terminal cleavage/methylation domain-containing protein